MNLTTPGPGSYEIEAGIARPRSSSTERNAPRCVIGNAKRYDKNNNPTPGPDNYNTMSQISVGGPESIGVTIGNAIRPISARPGEIKKNELMPGPGDYKVVNTDTYLRRRFVIPRNSFTTSHRGTVEKIIVPGPNHYLPN
jgi:hypothetical protein